jgi:small nuclear ribonucleoprotein (snRNP)-like protein
MKKSIYLLLLLLSFSAFSQHKTLELTNIKTGKIKVFEENQRVKIRTLNHKKWIGNLKIVDNQHFLINNQSINIDSLQSIKNQPKSLGTVKTAVLFSGLAIVGASIVSAAQGNESAFNLFAIGAGTTISAGIIEGLNSNYTSRKWKFKIIDPSLKGDLTKQK